MIIFALIKQLKLMEQNKKPSNPDLYKGQVNMLQDRVTLRDYFSGSVMQGFISTYSSQTSSEQIENSANDIARMSYIMADAMLKQREL